MHEKSSGWLRIAWKCTVRYWSFICLLFILLPVWVAFINREDDFSPGDQLGLMASLVPAAFGILLAYSLHRLSRLAAKNAGTAGDIGQHLGVGLIVLSLGAMFLSLLTFNGLLFMLFVVGLLLPAGLLAGTSAELARTAKGLAR